MARSERSDGRGGLLGILGISLGVKSWCYGGLPLRKFCSLIRFLSDRGSFPSDTALVP